VRDPDRYRVDTRSMLEKLQSPWPIILKWVRRLSQASDVKPGSKPPVA